MLGHVRERDRATGDRTGRTRTGDVTLALRQNLHSPDGSGFSLAILPYATLPLGGDGFGAGDWGAGLVVPVGFELGTLSLGLLPNVAAAVDAGGQRPPLVFVPVPGQGVEDGNAVGEG